MSCASVVTEPTMGDVVIRKATLGDLEDILTFLKQEYDGESTGSGFWCNRDLIEQGQAARELEVLAHPPDGKILAFCLWSIERGSMDIIEVRPAYRYRGLGRCLTQYILDRLRDQGFIGVEIQCMPQQSLQVWQKMGFRQVEKTEQPDHTFAVYLLRERRATLGDAETKAVVIQLTQLSGRPLESKTAVVQPSTLFCCRGTVRNTACILEEDFAAYLPLGSHHAITVQVEGYTPYLDEVKYSADMGVEIRGNFVRCRALNLSSFQPDTRC